MHRKWLVQIRNDKNLTQETVATRSEIKRAYYTQIEIGVRNPSVPIAKRIAKTLEFDWTFFFESNSGETRQNDVSEVMH